MGDRLSYLRRWGYKLADWLVEGKCGLRLETKVAWNTAERDNVVEWDGETPKGIPIGLINGPL